MNKICQSIKVEMNADLLKIIPKIAQMVSAKANNITHTLLDTWQRIIILLRLFWLGAVREGNSPPPADGGDPLARLCSSFGRSAVRQLFRLSVRDRVKLCTLSRGGAFKNRAYSQLRR